MAIVGVPMLRFDSNARPFLSFPRFGNKNLGHLLPEFNWDAVEELNLSYHIKIYNK